jgi:ribosomal protein S18 acetylase RimI-like enzyme
MQPRLATLGDIPALNALSAACFPHSLFWSGDHAATRRWWRNAILSEHAETWVFEDDARPVAVMVALIDEAAWLAGTGPQRMTPLEKALQVIRFPLRFLRNRTYRSKPDAKTPIPHNALPLTRGTRLFIEQFAVSPDAQGRNLGKRLVRLSLERAAHHGLAGAFYMVDRANAPMLGLMAREGFAIVQDGPRQFGLGRLC